MRWVETFHDQTILVRYPRFSPDTRRLFVKAMSSAAAVIAIGEPIRDLLVDIGVPAERVVVGQPLLPARGALAPLPSEYVPFFASHAPVWVTVGAFDPLYDLHTVAAAFHRFVLREPRAGLVVVIGRFGIDEAYERELRAALGDIAGSVLFVEDVPNDQAVALYGASTLLIRGPRLESFGRARRASGSASSMRAARCLPSPTTSASRFDSCGDCRPGELRGDCARPSRTSR